MLTTGKFFAVLCTRKLFTEQLEAKKTSPEEDVSETKSAGDLPLLATQKSQLSKHNLRELL